VFTACQLPGFPNNAVGGIDSYLSRCVHSNTVGTSQTCMLLKLHQDIPHTTSTRHAGAKRRELPEPRFRAHSSNSREGACRRPTRPLHSKKTYPQHYAFSNLALRDRQQEQTLENVLLFRPETQNLRAETLSGPEGPSPMVHHVRATTSFAARGNGRGTHLLNFTW